MNFLHTEFSGGSECVAIVSLNGQANVMLVDDLNFAAYKSGRSFNYFGGWQRHSPIRLSPPHYAHWHVVVDMGGSGGTVRAGVRIVRAPAFA